MFVVVVRSRYEEESLVAMSRALRYVEANLDEPLNPECLADVACFSRFHFHRVFRAVVGESVMDHVRRLRLERAAYRLKTSHEMVGTIAFDAGYGSQEAFTRTFQAYYGIPPRMFRYSHAPYILPAASGIHYSRNGFSPLRRVMDPELLDDSGLCVAHRNMPSEPGEQFQRLVNILTGFHFSELPCSMNQKEDFMNDAVNVYDEEIDTLLAEVELAKQKLAEARKRRPKEVIEDYVLQDIDGNDVRLAELFGGKDDLIVVHNMGASCIYCTVWADGLAGLIPHISDRAALILCSPDKPEDMKKFAAKRNWDFKMVSAAESSFPRDMGFWMDEGPQAGPWPGVSLFKREPDGSITRVGKTFLGPADEFCAVWPLFEMLEGGAKGWEPKFNYA